MTLDRKYCESRQLISHKTAAVYDNRFNELYSSVPWQSWFEDPDPLRCRLEYLDVYWQYLSAMQMNTIHGLRRFNQRHLINGTTQTFDEAYHRYAGRRLRIYRGEYAYHKRVVPEFVFIEDQPIAVGDYVIVSVPHCTTGAVPVDFDRMLDACAAMHVPVIVDCAYIGTCHGIEFSVEHPAIESVSFSLTKGTGLGHVRSGVRFSDFDDNYPIAQQNRFDHTVLGAARIGLWFMSQLQTPDFIPQRYRQHQISVCADLGVIPTPCMHIALGDGTWNDYVVDGYNRIGIRDLVKARRQGKI
jgi:hypothetical protein